MSQKFTVVAMQEGEGATLSTIVRVTGKDGKVIDLPFGRKSDEAIKCFYELSALFRKFDLLEEW